MSGDPAVVEEQARPTRKPRVTELIVLIGTVAVAGMSLLWLAIAAVWSPADRVRWGMWTGARSAVSAGESLATPTAVLISVIVMLVLVGLAVLGYVRTSPRRRRHSETALVSEVAAVAILPLAWTLPGQFAACLQSDNWAGDGHGLELLFRFGTWPAFIAGFLLLVVTKEFVKDLVPSHPKV